VIEIISVSGKAFMARMDEDKFTRHQWLDQKSLVMVTIQMRTTTKCADDTYTRFE